MVDIISKKKEGSALSREEIIYFIEGYTNGNIPDYQVSALLMAIFFQKMNKEETVYLTEAMMNSGDLIDLSDIEGIKVDKHSTGGVGDKTSIALGAMVAACGVPVAKMSGRGLGHTGGTIDKLEAISGFTVDMTKEQFVNNVNEIKLAIGGQTGDLAPADKKLYALRDVTATVDNISLIASSIMSKKLASGANAIVLDVKTGSGAFMKDLDDSFDLAQEMVQIGCQMNRETVALITDMDQPLGCAVGNSLEVKEAIETLKGNGPKDFTNLCIHLGAYMLLLAERVATVEDGKKMIQDTIDQGTALMVFEKFIQAQGGDPKVIYNTDLLSKSKGIYRLQALEQGYIHKIQADIIGMSALVLGAGRETKESVIDLSVGIVLNKKIGDFVEKGDILAYVHYNDESKKEDALQLLENAYEINEIKVQQRQLIFGIVSKEGMKRL
ncbi:pyrimidine-nucleoside phosphorylase [Alkaliphilus metalliredigens QYMF]|uniref:Pyrimidine-nucleoside phosphorylase n=1 Tax=Alkaliphilus metalliredigens (strain QYMF) TaxID=293826 RepID=A6TR62_ALKMQ|nr:pyrimidine-nucleoside phosphorylase [Alkaliphilus metalliredigens]ABR48680.1 pyrimidine-nucleoside phosphorylase [Alkaliphilus metalliredigens QYMF]